MKTVTRCRSCEAEIVWGVTPHGSRVPLDAKAELRYVERVRPLAAEGNDDGTVHLVAVYSTHFITCPDADRWRGSGSRDG